MKSNYKRYQGWCDRCDGERSEKGKKCTNCGFKDTEKLKRKNKLSLKEINQQINVL